MSKKPAAHPKIDMPPIADSLPIAMIRARERLLGPVREMLHPSGLTEQQWRILRVLEEYGAQDATQLAERSCLLMPSQTRIVQTMAEKGLVTRETSQQDRRRHVVTITDAGREILAQHAEQARAIARRIQDTLGKQKIRQLLDLLEEVRRI